MRAVKRQEALTRRIEDDVMKQHVNAIIDDDFWQVVKHEKLQEGDFEVKSSMSFGLGTSIDGHQQKLIDSVSRTSIDDTCIVDHLLQCCEDHDSRGVRSKTPTSAQPYLCQHRSAN